jgi:predicted phosphodiesterase
MHFDLYSDLHDNWWSSDKLLNYKGLGTSLVAVVAGDISNNWDYSYQTLLEISKHYRHVIFVEGNHEHNHQPNIFENCHKFQEKLKPIKNITYLYKSAIVLDDVAFVGCNGWWTFDFCQPEIRTADCWNSLVNEIYNEQLMSEIFIAAKADAQTLLNQVQTFDIDPRIRKIVVVTHTSPLQKFRYINDNMDFCHTGRAGNSLMSLVLNANTNKKIDTWCFGHVHRRYDEIIDGIRYVCHPRGREEENIGHAYFPKLIEV